MPYILLVFGILIGVYALYTFMNCATPQQIKMLLLSLAIGLVLLFIVLMLITGRLPIAAILAAVLIPLITSLYKALNTNTDTDQD